MCMHVVLYGDRSLAAIGTGGRLQNELPRRGFHFFRVGGMSHQRPVFSSLSTLSYAPFRVPPSHCRSLRSVQALGRSSKGQMCSSHTKPSPQGDGDGAGDSVLGSTPSCSHFLHID